MALVGVAVAMRSRAQLEHTVRNLRQALATAAAGNTAALPADAHVAAHAKLCQALVQLARAEQPQAPGDPDPSSAHEHCRAAVRHCRTAVSLASTSNRTSAMDLSKIATQARASLADALQGLGRRADALSAYREAAELAPR